MNIKLIGAYVGAIGSGLVVLLAALLVMLQWGNHSDFSLFGKNIDDANTALLMLCSVAFGVALLWLLKLLLKCAMVIGHFRRDSAVLGKAAAKAVSKQSAPADSAG